MAQTIDGKWEIVKKLGEGGQAETFLVTDTANGERAVLKRLKNPNRLLRFEQEVKAIASLNHPHVLRLLAANTSAPKPYLVSEFCELGSLEDCKAELLDLSVDDRLDLFRQVCEGVAAAHYAKIVHRDLKPSNIFLRASREVVVGDFGVCFIQSSERLTDTMEAVGARYYIAPELAEGRLENVTAKADVYSLGKILYWLLTGKIFDREDHRRRDRLLSDIYEEDCMLQVHQLLDVMITYNPDERNHDAGAVAFNVRKLRRLLAGKSPTLEHPPKRCRYCGDGNYKLLGNSRNKTAVFNFGFDPTNVVPHIFVCSNCGHVLMFRPAYSAKPDWLGHDAE